MELKQRITAASNDLVHRLRGYGEAERRYLASCPSWLQDPERDAKVSTIRGCSVV